MVQDACAAAKYTYKSTTGKDPDPRQLFRLAFWLLAGKVFCDRRINDSFARLSPASPVDDVLKEVAGHYGQPLPVLLNLQSRQAVHQTLWSGFDFRNLSLDVLTHIWANTFVTPDVRKGMGIHPTPRPVAKYIVDELPFENIPSDERNVVEPCCGSATFLVAALQRLRDQPEQSRDERARHEYFQSHLVGFERDPFGKEISQLCLTLADFPNSNGWMLYEQDVFRSSEFLEQIARARIVLCNPPFETLGQNDPNRGHVSSVKQPVALLELVLANLHPDGILGFVMPRALIDGDGYSAVRAQLVARFSGLHIVSLPENVFETAEHETALVIAHEPRRVDSPPFVSLRYVEVSKADWPNFESTYRPTSDETAMVSNEQASKRLALRQLEGIWSKLHHFRRLGEIAKIQRGFEWKDLPLKSKDSKTGKNIETGNRELLVRDKPNGEFFHLGIRPQKHQKENPLFAFDTPSMAYLRMRPGDERAHSYRKPWERANSPLI